MADLSEIRAGLFVVSAMAILGAATLWIVGFSPARGKKVEYEVAMKSSSGVRRGDRTRVSGIEVGRVKSIRLRTGEEWPVLFAVGMDADVQLTEGATARITSDGLLGAPYLQIDSGPSDAPPLAPGTRIYGGEAGTLTAALDGLGTVVDRLPALLEETTDLVGKINREIEPLLLGFQGIVSDENVAAITDTLATLGPTLQRIGPQLSTLIARLEGFAGGVEESIAGVPELTSEITGLTTDLRSAIGVDGARLVELFERTEATLSSADMAISTIGGNGTELDAMIHDLRESAANLRSLSQTLKEHPSLLLRYPKPPERQPAGDGQ